jgi:hypothetical protein
MFVSFLEIGSLVSWSRFLRDYFVEDFAPRRCPATGDDRRDFPFTRAAQSINNGRKSPLPLYMLQSHFRGGMKSHATSLRGGDGAADETLMAKGMPALRSFATVSIVRGMSTL